MRMPREAQGFAHAHAIHAAVFHGVQGLVENVTGHRLAADHGGHAAVALAGGVHHLRHFVTALAVLPPLADAEIHALFETQPLDFIEAAAQLADIADPQRRQRPDHLHLHQQERVGDLPRVQVHIAELLHDQIAGGDTARAAVVAVAVAVAADGHHGRGAPDHAVCAERNRLDHILVGADAAADKEFHVIAQTVLDQPVMNERNSILDVHAHLAFDDVGRSAGAAARAIQPDFDFHAVFADIIRHLPADLFGGFVQFLRLGFDRFFGVVLGDAPQPGGNEFDIHRRRDFHRNHRLRIDHPHHVHKRLHILDGIAVVERERRDDAGI